jgi:16S rRNA (guanine527-N7)-methyltransferase
LGGVTLLDANNKRVSFLEELCDALSIDSAVCVHARAEELGRKDGYREAFDIVISRAVAHLDVLCELCLPFVCVGGVFLAMKSADSDAEIADSLSAITALGGDAPSIAAYTLPRTDITRRLVVVRKSRATAPQYPRRYARILRDSL